jgi:hypothetical protein
MALDFFCFLPNAIHTAGTLDQADDGPRQVVIDHDGAVLQVLALAENICSNEDTKLLFWHYTISPLITPG